MLFRSGELVKAEKVKVRDDYCSRIRECEDPHDIEGISQDVAQDSTLTIVDMPVIELVILERLRALGVQIDKRRVQQMLKPKRTHRGNDGTIEDWCKLYIWCNQTDTFINTETQQLVSVQSFNAMHGRDVKGRWLTPDGFQMSASQVALQEIQIPVVGNRMYLPWAEQFFDYDGMRMLNSYRPSSVPDAKERPDWDADDLKAVKLFEEHADRLLGPESSIVLDWMAYCVQKPGDKIKWSVLIKGIQGDGKSYLGEVRSEEHTSELQSH